MRFYFLVIILFVVLFYVTGIRKEQVHSLCSTVVYANETLLYDGKNDKDITIKIRGRCLVEEFDFHGNIILYCEP